jgi:hypothetical protein
MGYRDEKKGNGQLGEPEQERETGVGEQDKIDRIDGGS